MTVSRSACGLRTRRISMDNFSQDELLRYSRQLMVSEFGPDAQTALKNASALIIGAGGLGSAIAVQLTAMGIGRLQIVDHDTIETTNLHRQTSYTSGDVGTLKVEALQQRLRAINPHVQVDVSAEKFAPSRLSGRPDIVIDGSDNFDCRFAVNRYCVAQRIPLISGAAIRQTGQLISFANNSDNAPCYACLYPEDAGNADTCSTAGVLPPVVSIIAAAQSMATVQLIAGLECPSLHVLHQFNLATMTWRQSRAVADPTCTCQTSR